ncbi:hypothetical protein NEMBOFW57_010047 [Staphylotrichum longicolle]|uniref:Ima1 N-terminal domain-containing protein n=1 Tax=Staphylotrichum longicolle TaxID=669026 RepID=A0AAD4HWI0_9PEZI|nr:hypothetical protein NEMBOFW57_010047 [Staphylotrichum longicolle]
MPRLHRTRYLTCFYCGRRNSTLYDGATRRFECPFCDATNYLDENGDITDPPVATDKEATPRQYAVSRAVSPPSSPSSNPIFCATCLKNQHLLSASLAQYLPDPDDPDYAEREKGLYRFRKNQERLYPQICADCEPRVRRQLEQAAYTAKTDLLRRMLDRSASARKSVKTHGWLDTVDAAGRWLWIAGFVLQLAWHAVVVHSLLSQYLMWAGVDETLFTFRMLRICGPFVGRLPSAERLLGWSSLASIVGVWWNPRFVQIFRGFTRHISGVSKWYFFQAVALSLRICLQRWDLTTPDPVLLGKQTAGHGFAAAFAILRLIHPTPPPTPRAPKPLPGLAPRRNEIHRRPPRRNLPLPDLPDPALPTDNLPPSPLQQRRTNPLPMGHAHTQAAQALTANLSQINHLNLSHHQPRPSPSLYSNHPSADEMDWSPTPSSSFTSTTTATPNGMGTGTAMGTGTGTEMGTGGISRHRAFNTQNQRPPTSQSFGSAPTEPRKGPFWYRVPPAPTTPAQRVFNPPNQPRLRPSPVDSGTQVGFRFGKTGTGGETRPGGVGGVGGGGEQRQVVAFAEPTFFAADLERKRGGKKKA